MLDVFKLDDSQVGIEVKCHDAGRIFTTVEELGGQRRCTLHNMVIRDYMSVDIPHKARSRALGLRRAGTYKYDRLDGLLIQVG